MSKEKLLLVGAGGFLQNIIHADAVCAVFLLRTISGTITPLSRMLSTNSFISISLRTWNGWLAKVCNSAGETFNSRLFGMINPFFPSFISHKAKYIYKIRTFLLTFSVQSVIIIKLIRDSPVDRV